MKKQGYFLALLIAASFQTHAAEITVAPNSMYFSGWNFSSLNPNSRPERINMSPGETISGTFNGSPLSWTVNASPTPDTFGVWTNGFNAFGTNLPANISRPSPSPGQGFINRGEAQFSSTSPFPTGTTIFFQDVDNYVNDTNRELANFRFYNCSGGQIDAAGFDFLKISTINTPSYSIQGAAPSQYWQVAATIGSDPNTVNGITIRSHEVCRIDIQALRPGSGGSINYFLGAPPNAVPTAAPTISGTLQVGSMLTGKYTYADNESDIENPAETTYKFVTSSNAAIANSAEGTTVASGTTGGASDSVPYTLQSGDLNLYIYYCVVPAAQTGASPGVEVCTVASGPVTEKPVAPKPTTPTTVPTVGVWGLISMSSMLAVFGLMRSRRRSA